MSRAEQRRVRSGARTSPRLSPAEDAAAGSQVDLFGCAQDIWSVASLSLVYSLPVGRYWLTLGRGQMEKVVLVMGKDDLEVEWCWTMCVCLVFPDPLLVTIPVPFLGPSPPPPPLLKINPRVCPEHDGFADLRDDPRDQPDSHPSPWAVHTLPLLQIHQDIYIYTHTHAHIHTYIYSYTPPPQHHPPWRTPSSPTGRSRRTQRSRRSSRGRTAARPSRRGACPGCASRPWRCTRASRRRRAPSSTGPRTRRSRSGGTGTCCSTATCCI